MLRKYFAGLVMDSPTNALAAKCRMASALASPTVCFTCAASLEAAVDKLRARIHGGAMPFGEIVENGDVMAGVEQFLNANRPDVSRAAGH